MRISGGGSIENFLKIVLPMIGWSPFTLPFTHKPEGVDFTHVGSIDIHLVIDPVVIDPDIIDEVKYETIIRMLLNREYQPSEEDFSKQRN